MTAAGAAGRARLRQVTVPAAHPSVAESISPTTSDGVTLRGVHLPHRGSDLAFVVSHGMTNAIGKPTTRRVIDTLSAFGGVVAVDFRGHGRSGGRSTVGRDEVHDVDAAVSYARAAGYPTVVTVGFSMGGAVTLRYAGSSHGDGPGRLATRPDAVVSVSAPSRWYIRSSTSMRRVHWLLEHPFGGLVGRAAGIRLGTPWPVIPSTPLESVGQIAPIPLLIVHGTADHYFSPQEALDLHRAAPGSELWLEPGMAHAESGISRDAVERIARWALAACPNGSKTHATHQHGQQ